MCSFTDYERSLLEIARAWYLKINIMYDVKVLPVRIYRI